VAVLAAGAAVPLAGVLGEPVGSWLMAVATATAPVALFRLGSGGSGRLRLGRRGLPALLVSLGAACVALVALAGWPGRAPALAGLGVLLLGIWLVPLVVTSWGFAASFPPPERWEQELRALQAATRERPDR
jgi:hypothetical protein